MENVPFLIGKPSINGPFSMAMVNNQRVTGRLFWFLQSRKMGNRHWLRLQEPGCWSPGGGEKWLIFRYMLNYILYVILVSWFIYDTVSYHIIYIILRANTPICPHPSYAVHLGISNVRLYIHLGRSTRVSREYKFPTPVKLLHSLKIFNKGLILPPPLNF